MQLVMNLLSLLKKNKIFLIEDVCESHGANSIKKNVEHLV
jgi:dTDP-4-amino-4,6-dideoxygalactose transaminase